MLAEALPDLSRLVAVCAVVIGGRGDVTAVAFAQVTVTAVNDCRVCR
jgi:hypothetical protein